MNKILLLSAFIFLSIGTLSAQEKVKKFSVYAVPVLTSGFRSTASFIMQQEPGVGIGVALKYETSPEKTHSLQVGIGLSHRRFFGKTRLSSVQELSDGTSEIRTWNMDSEFRTLFLEVPVQLKVRLGKSRKWYLAPGIVGTKILVDNGKAVFNNNGDETTLLKFSSPIADWNLSPSFAIGRIYPVSKKMLLESFLSFEYYLRTLEEENLFERNHIFSINLGVGVRF